MGIPFFTSDENIVSHFTRHAPTLTTLSIDRVWVNNNHDIFDQHCFFSLAASQISLLPTAHFTDSTHKQPLQWAKHNFGQTQMCSFCFKMGHKKSVCPSLFETIMSFVIDEHEWCMWGA